MNTGEPLSVIQPQIRHDLDLVVSPEPNWTDPVPDWCGVPCRIGRVEIWLEIQGLPPFRAFSLLALLPTRAVAFQPPFVLLGVQFLLEHQAALSFDCSAGTPAAGGRLVIP